MKRGSSRLCGGLEAVNGIDCRAELSDRSRAVEDLFSGVVRLRLIREEGDLP